MTVSKWKLAAGKTWRSKLEADHPSHGKVVPMPAQYQKRYGVGEMLIPRPRDVDAIMRRVRKGKLLTQTQLREQLARAAGVAATCPLTTGIFIRIVAETAEEDLAVGKKRVTPYWRTIRDGGALNDKYPGGARAQAERLAAEGFAIQRGRGAKSLRVEDFERALVLR